MSSKRTSKHSVFQLGLRLAAYITIPATFVLFLIEWFVLGLEPLHSVILTVSAAFILFILCYVTMHIILSRRIEMLEMILKNIAQKKFMEYEDVTTMHSDEVDYLIKQGIKSSQTIEREIQRLNRMENYRKEFIGDISHELKTPIFAIQGFIETLLNGALEDEEVNRDFLKKAMRNVNRLTYLTKDLMEISKLETGELKSEIEVFSLKEALHDIIESLNYKAEKEDINLIVHDVDENIQVKGDRNQIKQVLINLIENGIKYNVPKGKVEVQVFSKHKHPKKVFVTVKDSGIGIDEKDIPRVTERFFRVDKSRSRERGGTGLGLAIVKHIMEAHGETFTIQSEPNHGSTFTISLKRR